MHDEIERIRSNMRRKPRPSGVSQQLHASDLKVITATRFNVVHRTCTAHLLNRNGHGHGRE